MDEVLDKEKISEIFSQIFVSCPKLVGRSLKIMPPNADSVYSKGFQIHISPNNDDSLQMCIEKIAKSNDLGTAVENDTIIIFNPLKVQQPARESNKDFLTAETDPTVQ